MLFSDAPEDEENLARFFCKVASLSTCIYIQMVPLGFLGFRQFQNEGTSYFSLSLFTGSRSFLFGIFVVTQA